MDHSLLEVTLVLSSYWIRDFVNGPLRVSKWKCNKKRMHCFLSWVVCIPVCFVIIMECYGKFQICMKVDGIKWWTLMYPLVSFIYQELMAILVSYILLFTSFPPMLFWSKFRTYHFIHKYFYYGSLENKLQKYLKKI